MTLMKCDWEIIVKNTISEWEREISGVCKGTVDYVCVKEKACVCK